MNKTIAIVMCVVVAALQAHAGHVMIDGSYSCPATGLYPGTERTYQVYVPEQYTGSEPACLYVGLDGVLCNAPTVIDSLIEAGAMPVTIGVFLQPGVIRDSAGEVLRYNRSNEFDATDDRFVRFLSEELLPQVETLSTVDGRRIRLSAKPGDRMIFGLSSGGISAFVAAWHRPDCFGRVFSGVGTFVAMRGGNDLQAIVRKSEPRPLRIFLQDGSNDAWNALFGHWYEGNQMLASALNFAGYDARYDWSDGGHNVKRSTEIFADVMTWMWHDWPEPPHAGTTQNDFLNKILIADHNEWQSHKVEKASVVNAQEWQERQGMTVSIGGEKRYAAHYPDNTLLAASAPETNFLWQWVVQPDGSLAYGERFYYLHSYDNSQLEVGPMTFDGDGNLWVLTSDGLQACDQNGRVRGILMCPVTTNFERVTAFYIGDGSINVEVALSPSMVVRYERRLAITPPETGVRPKSQGQG